MDFRMVGQLAEWHGSGVTFVHVKLVVDLF